MRGWYPGRVNNSHPGSDDRPPSGAHPSSIQIQNPAELALAVLTRRTSCAQAARAAGVTEAEVELWTRRFLDAGAAGLRPGGPPKRVHAQVPDLAAGNAALRERLHETCAQVELWRTVAGGVLGPSGTLR